MSFAVGFISYFPFVFSNRIADDNLNDSHVMIRPPSNKTDDKILNLGLEDVLRLDVHHFPRKSVAKVNMLTEAIHGKTFPEYRDNQSIPPFFFGGWWFGTWILSFHILRISSSQLTKVIFFRGIQTTNQTMLEISHVFGPCLGEAVHGSAVGVPGERPAGEVWELSERSWAPVMLPGAHPTEWMYPWIKRRSMKSQFHLVE